jgi:hypothetical protein
MKLFNKIIIVVLALIVCGMGYLIYDIHSIQNPKFTKTEEQSIALGFYQVYGSGTIISIEPINKYYEVTWQDSKNEYMSVDLNGKWVVIAQQALPTTTTTTTP